MPEVNWLQAELPSFKFIYWNKFDIMNKLLLLLLLVPMVSCSSDDDDTTGATDPTDPLIGTWTTSYTELGVAYNDSYKTNSNGTYIYTEDDDDEYAETGKWSNDGTDFNSRNQIYSLTEDNYLSFKITTRFSSDFNSFEFFEGDDSVFVRQ